MSQFAFPRPGLARLARPLAVPHVSAAVRWAFYAFAFIVPLENFDPFGVASVFSLGKMAGYAFALIALTQPTVCFARPPKAFWLFGFYLAAYFLIGVTANPEYTLPTFATTTTVLQNLILFWISFNLMREEGVARGVFYSLITSVTTLSVLALIGIGITRAAWQDAFRVTAAQYDPNALGYLLVVTIFAAFGLAFGGRLNSWKMKFLAWPLFFVLASLLVASGSRGAMVCAAAGLLAFVTKYENFWAKLRTSALIGVITAAALALVLGSAIAVLRWKATLAGHLGTRPQLVALSGQMFLERPVVGWGAWEHLVELGKREGKRSPIRDTHNDLMWALTATGLVGTIPVLWAVFTLIGGAWRARRGVRGVVPFVLLVAALTMSLSVTVHKRKITWLIFGYVAASGAVVAGARTGRTPPPAQLRPPNRRRYGAGPAG